MSDHILAVYDAPITDPSQTVAVVPPWRYAMKSECHRYRWTLTISASFALIIFIAVWLLPAPVHLPTWTSTGVELFGGFIAMTFNLAIVAGLAFLLGLFRVGRRPHELWRDLRSADASARTAILLLAWPVFTFAFVQWKSAFSVIVPWNLDMLFATWDTWLHGGVAPHKWVTPWLTQPWVFTISGVIYDLIWPIVLCGGLPAYAMIMGRDKNRAARYMFASVACWVILGSIAAPLLHSAGPVFAQMVTGLPLYPDLYNTLQAAGQTAIGTPILSLALQTVHDAYQPGQATYGALSMAAMPSLHVAIAMLAVCYAWNFGWVWRVLALAALIAISVIAVGTGWHYAIDVYVAIGGAWVIWWAAGKLQMPGKMTLNSPQMPVGEG